MGQNALKTSWLSGGLERSGHRKAGPVSPVKSGNGNRGSERIDLRDAAGLARWAERLATSIDELKNAVDAVGPELERVKRYLFLSLLRRDKGRK